MFVVAGDAGIGKTRLLTEVAALTALEGVKVFSVRCQPHYASRPLSVFIELVPALLAVRGALGISAESIASLNSLTSHIDERSERPLDARDDVTRSELLLAAIRDLVDAVASEQPLLLAVEDAHWADRQSLRELHNLVQSASGTTLVIVCTTRNPEVLAGAQGTNENVVLCRLKPLSSDAMGQLASRILPTTHAHTHSDLVTWSVRTACGNPLLLQMLCSHYAATGDANTVPPDVLAAVRRRVEVLTPDNRRLLALIALLGRHANIDVLRSVTGSDYWTLLDGVQYLEENGYLHSVAGGFQIAHDLLKDSALALYAPGSRKVLHACAAAALEARYETTRDASVLWDCAEQWTASGESDKAAHFLRQCARHAVAIGRAPDAIGLLERCQSLVSYPATAKEVLGDIMIIASMSHHWASATAAARQYELLIPAQRVHDDAELALLDICWQGSHGVDHHIRAMQCASCPSASSEHRVGAARLLLTIAHERCDKQLGQSAYAEVADIVDPTNIQFAQQLVPINYEGVFGDQNRAFALCCSFAGSFDDLTMHERMRAASNVAASFAFIGAFAYTVRIATDHYHFAQRVGAKTWVREYANLACAGYIMLEDFAEAKRWYAIARKVGEECNADPMTSIRAANAIEIGLADGDTRAVADALAFAEGVIMSGPRWKAYRTGARARLRLLDPGFIPEPTELAELERLYQVAKQFGCCDGLALAIGESFSRAREWDRLRGFLQDYSEARRECSPLGPSLECVRLRLDNPPTFRESAWALSENPVAARRL